MGGKKGALAVLATWLCAVACGDDDAATGGGDWGGGMGDGDEGAGDGGSSSGGGADTGDGGDGGGDDGGDGGGDPGDDDGNKYDVSGEPPPPEEEEPADFRVPKASGKFVYSVSEKTNRVAVINTDNLVIDVVDSGHGPTVVAPIPGASGSEAGKVAVLCQGSDEATLIDTTRDGVNTVELRQIAPGANNIVAAPGGRHVISYFDVDGEGEGGAGSDQEITVLETGGSGGVYRLTVGSHPRDVQFSSDGETAYVTTDDGVNVLDLNDVAGIGLPDLVPVVDDPGIDPSTLEIQVSVAKGQALARVEGEDWLVVTDLATGEHDEAYLPGYATDLDIAEDGSFAVLMLPRKTGSLILEVALPVGAGPFFAAFSVGQEYVGVASLAADGDAMILYTTVDPWAEDGEQAPLGDPRKRVTIARRGSGDWSDQITLYTEVPVRSVGIAPDSENALLLHDRDASINPAAPWPYTLLDLTAAFPVKKLQTAQAEPGPVVFTPDGDRAGVLLREDAANVRRVDMVNLRNFIVKAVDLGSPPEGAGYVEATKKIFISQEHPSGRITFIDQEGKLQTVTGYELNDSVKD